MIFRKLVPIATLVIFTLGFTGLGFAAFKVSVPTEGLSMSGEGDSEVCISLIKRESHEEIEVECPPESKLGNYPVLRRDRGVGTAARQAILDHHDQDVIDSDNELRNQVQARLRLASAGNHSQGEGKD